MIQGLVQSYQKHHQVTISADAVKAAVMLSARALPDRHLPDKAIDLIDEASAKVHLSSMAQRKATTGKLPTVTAKDIREVLTTWVSDLNLLSKLKK
jgi:ATP-dependent Clp protease ATP-binding subunit ClpC